MSEVKRNGSSVSLKYCVCMVRQKFNTISCLQLKLRSSSVDHFCPLGGSTRQKGVWSALSIRWRSQHYIQYAAASQRTEQHPVDQSVFEFNTFSFTLTRNYSCCSNSHFWFFLQGPIKEAREEPRTCETWEFLTNSPFGLPPLCLLANLPTEWFSAVRGNMSFLLWVIIVSWMLILPCHLALCSDNMSGVSVTQLAG